MAETEACGAEFDDDEAWSVDVLATRRTVTVAFEVELSAQTWADMIQRRRRYRRAMQRVWPFDKFANANRNSTRQLQPHRARGARRMDIVARETYRRPARITLHTRAA